MSRGTARAGWRLRCGGHSLPCAALLCSRRVWQCQVPNPLANPNPPKMPTPTSSAVTVPGGGGQRPAAPPPPTNSAPPAFQQDKAAPAAPANPHPPPSYRPLSSQGPPATPPPQTQAPKRASERCVADKSFPPSLSWSTSNPLRGLGYIVLRQATGESRQHPPRPPPRSTPSPDLPDDQDRPTARPGLPTPHRAAPGGGTRVEAAGGSGDAAGRLACGEQEEPAGQPIGG